MAEIYLAKYLPGDEAAFIPRPDMAEDMAANGWDWSQGAPGPTWTLMRWDGEFLGIGGFVKLSDNGWEAWSVLSSLRLRDWPRVLELAKMRLEALGSSTVLACCRSDSAGAMRVLDRLGFGLGAFGFDDRLPGTEIQHMWRFA